MGLDREFSEDGKELTIFIEEKFDFGKFKTSAKLILKIMKE